MTPRRIALIAGTIALLALLIWDHWRRAPEVQVPATFTRLAAAIDDHDAADVMACVDRAYDFSGKWPQLFSDPQKGRADAQRLLALAFLSTRSDPTALDWTLHSITPQPDGTVVAVVSLKVSGGRFTNAVPALDHHRFVLVKRSWLTGRYRILDHAPFTLDVPGQ